MRHIRLPGGPPRRLKMAAQGRLSLASNGGRGGLRQLQGDSTLYD